MTACLMGSENRNVAGGPESRDSVIWRTDEWYKLSVLAHLFPLFLRFASLAHPSRQDFPVLLSPRPVRRPPSTRSREVVLCVGVFPDGGGPSPRVKGSSRYRRNEGLTTLCPDFYRWFSCFDLKLFPRLYLPYLACSLVWFVKSY